MASRTVFAKFDTRHRNSTITSHPVTDISRISAIVLYITNTSRRIKWLLRTTIIDDCPTRITRSCVKFASRTFSFASLCITFIIPTNCIERFACAYANSCFCTITSLTIGCRVSTTSHLTRTLIRVIAKRIKRIRRNRTAIPRASGCNYGSTPARAIHINILVTSHRPCRQISIPLGAIKFGCTHTCHAIKRVGIAKCFDNGQTFTTRIGSIFPITFGLAHLFITSSFTNYIKRVIRANHRHLCRAPSIPNSRITNRLNKHITPRIGNRAKTRRQRPRALPRIIYGTQTTAQGARRPLCRKNITLTPCLIGISAITIGTIING